MEKSRIRDPVLARCQDVLPTPEHTGVHHRFVIHHDKESVLRIRIRDQWPFWSLHPGSGMVKKIRNRIRDEQPGSYFRELRNNFFGLKYLILLCGSGMEKSRIRDPVLARRQDVLPTPEQRGFIIIVPSALQEIFL
jgi:hypothetical protein